MCRGFLHCYTSRARGPTDPDIRLCDPAPAGDQTPQPSGATGHKVDQTAALLKRWRRRSTAVESVFQRDITMTPDPSILFPLSVAITLPSSLNILPLPVWAGQSLCR
ncbi:hypothetical protein AAFF_G00230380 [Aldrovandia affinis]|uniref:Uncharacterized protein n=1 Tax=Aldrovandia affinis TaxID=143900 RepID=A0AAD7RF15_9TELE|nr:hypothetical protein AAFF_G00230380 [Aldrovandia affinis]